MDVGYEREKEFCNPRFLVQIIRIMGRPWEGIGNSILSLLTLACLLDTQVEMAGGSWIQEVKIMGGSLTRNAERSSSR